MTGVIAFKVGRPCFCHADIRDHSHDNILGHQLQILGHDRGLKEAKDQRPAKTLTSFRMQLLILGRITCLKQWA